MRSPDMTDGKIIFDVRFLVDASKRLLGYLLYTWFENYMGVIAANVRRMLDQGVIGPDAQPTRETDYALLFDVDALDLEKLTYVIGFYFYIYSSHKKSNRYLMEPSPKKRVLYLRGYDYEGAVAAEEGGAVGMRSMSTTGFNGKLGEHLQGDFETFKVLSPSDFFWETADAQRHFSGDFRKIIGMCSQPIRSVYLNANDWQDGVARLVDRSDYFVVYVSSITESALWEIDLLRLRERTQHATVVFDQEAIANKAGHTRLQAAMAKDHPGYVRWMKSSQGAPALGPKELRKRLSKDFLVVSPEAFFADIDAHKRRIADAEAPAGPEERTAPIEFQFRPALDPAGLEAIRDFEAGIDDVIRAGVSSRTITNLPWFMNQVQLKIYTTLLLGNHEGTGRALAVYGAVADVVQKHIATEPTIPPPHRKVLLERLQAHRETADYVSHIFLSMGGSHDFGDHRRRARKIHDETFAAASQAVEAFFEEAERRRGKPPRRTKRTGTTRKGRRTRPGE